MERLIVDIVLSFAHFEPEVTAERIREKIAASKKKGLWMGGAPPLGYDPPPDPKTRGLVINAEEAGTVRAKRSRPRFLRMSAQGAKLSAMKCT